LHSIYFSIKLGFTFDITVSRRAFKRRELSGSRFVLPGASQICVAKSPSVEVAKWRSRQVAKSPARVHRISVMFVIAPPVMAAIALLVMAAIAPLVMVSIALLVMAAIASGCDISFGYGRDSISCHY
jgi:hypothetical protein